MSPRKASSVALSEQHAAVRGTKYLYRVRPGACPIEICRRPSGAPYASLGTRYRVLTTGSGPCCSELDLRPQLHDSIRRQPEEPRRGLGVAGHHDEQLLAPTCHARRSRRQQALAAEVVARLHRAGADALRGGPPEGLGGVPRLHEGPLHEHAEEALAELLHRNA